jgi:uncharacterized protein (DUF488 family)
MEPFLTIGHSTRPIEAFIALLRANEVTRLVDVRTVPRSRHNPQYEHEALRSALAASGIAYEHLASLGGLRPKSREIAPEVNGYWENASFHNYADYAMTDAFRAGLAHLREIGGEERCAIMCAEAVWWRCHRRIIADYLLALGEAVFHIVSSDVPEPARLTPEAEPGPGGSLVYPSRQRPLV